MFNYDKLKIAHELTEKIDGFCEFTLYANALSANLFKINYKKEGWCWEHHECYLNIDDLISKLTELTRTGPKYEVGQEVWFNDFDKPCTHIVKEIVPGVNSVWLYDGGPEGAFFSTKQALIEHQIKYWQSLSEEPQHCGISGVRLSNE